MMRGEEFTRMAISLQELKHQNELLAQRLATMEKQHAEEHARAIAKEDALNAEIMRLQQALTAEKTARENADSAERTAREGAIKTETTVRERSVAEERSLREKAITAEASTRASAINGETTAREKSDATDIAMRERIAAEVERLKGQVSTLVAHDAVTSAAIGKLNGHTHRGGYGGDGHRHYTSPPSLDGTPPGYRW